MNTIEIARENCAVAISQYYSDFGLLADMLIDSGAYRAYWETKNRIVLESISNNIFNPDEEVVIYELFRRNRKLVGFFLNHGIKNE